jgi:hypothetical protein
MPGCGTIEPLNHIGAAMCPPWLDYYNLCRKGGVRRGMRKMAVERRSWSFRRRCGGAFTVIAVASLAALSAGCSTERIFGSSSNASTATAPAPTTPAPSDNSPSATSRLADFFSFGRTPHKPTLPLYASPVATSCPELDVREGAATLTIPPDNADALALRYQGSIGKMSRDCNVSNGVMRMKIGVQGRILLGPAGGPGHLDVPLRLTVVREGPQPKPIIAKSYKVPVTIPQGQTNVPFTQIDENFIFPVPPGDDLSDYVVYVGFEPVTEAKKPAKKRPKKPAAKSHTSSRR